MKKSIKLFSVVLSAIFCFTMAITIMVSNSFKANADENNAVESFVMKDGFEIRVVEPLGLRVMTSIDATDKENLVNDGAQFGTLMLPERLLGADGKLTIDDSLVLDIKTSVWNDDGNSYNSVLFAGYGENQTFPDKFFNDPIVARSYYVLNGEYYYSNAVTRSMSYVAAAALADGKEIPVLTKTEQAIPATLTVNDGQELAFDGEYNAIFTVGGIVANSDKVAFAGNNSAVVSVDETTGKITAVGAGTATITATLGDVTASCEVTVAKKLVEGTQNYVFGHQQGDLVLNADAYDGDIVKVTMNDAEIATGSTVPATNFTTGEYKINVETAKTIYTENVKAVTGIIRTVEQFNEMQNLSDSTGETKGTFLLANDIDFKGAASAVTTSWNQLNFDGQGYAIYNAKVTNNYCGVFGKYLHAGTIKNVALVNFSITGNFQSGIVGYVNGGTIKDVYVHGYVGAASAVAQSALVAMQYVKGSIKDVVVNYDTTLATAGGAYAITRIMDAEKNADYDIPAGISNVYSIGLSTNHIVANVPTAAHPTWTNFVNLNKATGGYDSDTQFFANAQFSSDAFTVGEDANGTRVLKFFGKTVKHTVGYMNTDLIIDASELGVKDGDAVTVNYAGADLADVTVASGKITVPKTNFTAVGKGLITITVGENSYYRQLNVVTALINSVDTFKAISTYGGVGTYLQTKDIDFGNTAACATSTDVLENFNYDGQGYAIKDIKGTSWNGTFGKNFKSGTIKDVAIVGYNITGNYNAAVVADVSGGTIENVYVHGYVGNAANVAQSSLVSKGYYSGVIKNVVVNYDTTLATAGGAYAITRIMDAEKNADYDIPAGISNVYSIGLSTQHIVANVPTAAHPTWTNFVNLNKATGGYADATAFFGAKATVFSGAFNNAFRLVETDTATTMNFYGREVLSLAK